MNKLVLIFLVLLALKSSAQKLEYQILFEGIGDNREFFSGKSKSQTILGSRGEFEIGTTLQKHRVRAGLSHLFEFGSSIDYHQPRLILYYQYEDELKSFHFGSFPRRDLVRFPLALLSDTLSYFRPTIEGLRAEYRWQGGWQNGFIDWTGRQNAIVREAFTVGSSGQIGGKRWFVENYFTLSHLAGHEPRVPNEHIQDNLGYVVQAGFRSNNSSGNWQGYLKGGVLGSLFRERSVTDGFISAQSLLAEGYLKYKNFAAKSVLHSGEGHRLIHGDPFYRLENYLRSDIIWYFINGKNVKGRFNLSFHLIEWNDLDQSQQMSIVYVFPTR